MYRLGRLLRIAGILMIAVAISFAVYYKISEWKSASDLSDIISCMEENTNSAEKTTGNEIYKLAPDMEMPVKNVDGHNVVGTLEIPSLDLKLPVSDECTYGNLSALPCRYVGTAYKNGFVIAAHNYSTHFGRINRLIQGDRVLFSDTIGNSFTYRVIDTEILQPTEIDRMRSKKYDLTLFTCTLGGATRVTVRCEKIKTGE